jgi:hypothetical protein
MPVPRPGVAWPPTLPSWLDEHKVGGIGILSPLGAWVLMTEFGPLFFAALALGWRTPRTRALVLFSLLGAAFACGLTFHNWPKSDLDRCLFPGTAIGFFLCAHFVEVLAARAQAGRGWARARAIGLLGAIVVATLVTSLTYAVRQLARAPTTLTRPYGDRPAWLHAELSAVFPTEQILTTDPRTAQLLVVAGFIVSAPMTSNNVGEVDRSALFYRYLNAPPRRPDWLLLEPTHPLAVGQPVIEAPSLGRVLVRFRQE